jgi:hypothetical protein
MKKNMGITDRILRIGFAVVVGSLFLTNQISGILAGVLGLAAFIFIGTGFAGICPLYLILNISTRNKPVESGKEV